MVQYIFGQIIAIGYFKMVLKTGKITVNYFYDKRFKLFNVYGLMAINAIEKLA